MADSHHILWQRAVVDAVSDVAENIRRIVLRPERPCPIRPGEHVDVRTTIDGEQHVRSYSVVNAADDGTHLALSVYRTPNSRGGGSVFMHSLQPGGQRLEITQPLQNFPLRIGAPLLRLACRRHRHNRNRRDGRVAAPPRRRLPPGLCGPFPGCDGLPG